MSNYLSAERAQQHADKLRQDREQAVQRIEGYHKYIDGCTEEIGKFDHLQLFKRAVFVLDDCEKRIDEYRASIRRMQQVIHVRRQEAVTFRNEGDRLRCQADSLAVRYSKFYD